MGILQGFAGRIVLGALGIASIGFFVACTEQNTARDAEQESSSSSIVTDTTGVPLTQINRRPSPNILIILADDLGFSDLGAFGSEINTPNIDKLAASGLLLTGFNVGMSCSPTRATLLSGVDRHKNGLGRMAGLLTSEQRGKPGYETYLNYDVVSDFKLLQDAGYHTYMAGKWHLGFGDNYLPNKRGFEESFALLDGAASHFDEVGQFSFAPIASYRENGQVAHLPDKFYSSEFYTDKLIEYIDKHRGDGKPFIAYAAYTAPHWPLQAPDEYISKYEGVYDAGYEKIREQRIKRMKNLGIIPDTVIAAPQEKVWLSWEDVPNKQKPMEVRKMQVYAAMVDALDHQVGRLIAHLDEIGELDNTFIIFMSDNGPEGSSPSDIVDTETWVAENFDNSLENMGRQGSYIWYGPGWAHVSATPFRLYKAYPTNGGVVSPAFFVYPGHIEPGNKSNVFATILDIAPTLLEVAKVDHPGSSYNGRKIYPLQGESMLSFLLGEQDSVHNGNYFYAWEAAFRRAVRKGDWKALSMNKLWGKGYDNWSLYNVATDPAEQHDLADEDPEKLLKMIGYWDRYAKENGVVPGSPPLGGFTNTVDYYQKKSPSNENK